MAKLRFLSTCALAILGVGGLGPDARAIEKGKFVPWAYTCHFGKYGTVVIDGTKKGVVHLIAEGKTYLVVQGGSYAFATEGEKGPVVYFGPDQKWFEYKGVRDSHCTASNAVSAAAASSIPQAPKLEGMAYQKARKTILGYGWRPMRGSCGLQVSESACARFPEIGTCSGVDPGYCGMTFTRQDRCLNVVTRGGPPEGDVEGDTHVDHVTFRSGPCAKD
jgi:hypothetical protein